MKKWLPKISLLLVLCLLFSAWPLGVKGQIPQMPGETERANFAAKMIRQSGSSDSCGLTNITACVKKAVAYTVAFFAVLILALLSLLVKVAGQAFDFSIKISVAEFANYVKQLAGIDLAWGHLRDLANVLFIFIVLYIAFKIILQLASGDAKRMLIKVLVVALLINFSAFFTRAVIDASNVLAYQFYTAITGKGSSGDGGASAAKIGIADSFLWRTGILTSFTAPDESTFTGKIHDIAGGNKVNIANALSNSIGSILLYVVAAVVFVAGAVMFLWRTLALIILIILSPLAFMAYAFPGLEKHATNWWGQLFRRSFFAPICLFFIYSSIKIAEGIVAAKDQLIPQGAGMEPAVITAFKFALIMGLLIASLIIANSLGAAGAGAAMGGLKRLGTFGLGAVTGGVAAGGLARLGRGTFGRAGQALRESKWATRLEAKGGLFGKFGTGVKRAGGAMAKSSFDVRATKVGKEALKGMGIKDFKKAGGKGGFEAAETEKEAEKGRAQQESYADIKSRLGEEAANAWLKRQKTIPEEILGTGKGIGKGAALGAAIGSVVPGVGTAAGATVGGAVGGLWRLGSRWRHRRQAKKHRQDEAAARAANDPVREQASRLRAERSEAKTQQATFRGPAVSPELNEDLANKREKELNEEINRLEAELAAPTILGPGGTPLRDRTITEQQMAETKSALAKLRAAKAARKQARAEAQKKLGKKPAETYRERIEEILGEAEEAAKEAAKGGGKKE